ncbi:MAG: beta-ketoacyl synthase N-terminal-like domain-containing protein [Chloroflexota bacterium]
MTSKRKLARGVAVVGAGITRFGVYPKNVASADLFVSAFLDLKDAADKGFDDRDIDALYLGNLSSELFEGTAHIAADVMSRLGLTPRPAVRVENACASSGVAFREGVIAIASGMCDVVLVGGVEKMTNLDTTSVTGVLSLALDPALELASGETFPGIFATIATAHMAKYGTSPEDLMRVAIKNHNNASLNPKAHLKSTIKDIMKKRASACAEKGLSVPGWRDEMEFLGDLEQNPYVAYPLRLFDCSTVCDGASCVLLIAEDRAREFTDKPIYVAGLGQASDDPLGERSDLTSMRSVREAARQAYEMAGATPKDIKLAEVHDCFTIAEVLAMEDLGFYPPGEAVRAIKNGETELTGRLPINSDGGLKAKGHPIGATGTGMVVELFKQMRGEAGARQIKGRDLDLGLMLNIGAHGGNGGG